MSTAEFGTDLRLFWYPISKSVDLLGGDVVGLHILGDPICLFREKESGKAACISDRCAHRSAPLSIGNMTDGVLECKYHGWKYDLDGRVTHIPALLTDRSIPANAKVYSYPLVERYGLIWIWPGPKEDADERRIPDIMPGSNLPNVRFTKPFVQVFDLDCDHSLMVENLLDPAHLPFTHAGTLSKRSKAVPLKFDIDTYEAADWALPNMPDGDPRKHFPILRGILEQTGTNMCFAAPCHLLLKTQFKPGYHFQQTMHCIPLRPNHMRLIYSHAFSFSVDIMDFLAPIMTPYMNRSSAKIVFQDYELLHGQQIRLKQGAKPWHSPIQVDGPPKIYRNWITKCTYYTGANTNGGSLKSVKQDDYQVVGSSNSKSPYFGRWKVDVKSSDAVTDIEDLGADCSTMCGGETGGSILDDEWYYPKQRNVDSSAYTWRRDLLFGRAQQSWISWQNVGFIGTVSVLAGLAGALLGRLI